MSDTPNLQIEPFPDRVPYHTCTADNPWKFDGPRCYHPDAVPRYVTINVTVYTCPHCGAQWREEAGEA